MPRSEHLHRMSDTSEATYFISIELDSVTNVN